MKVVVRRALPPPVRGRRRRRGAIIAYMVLAFVVFLGMGALVIDMGVHYQRKASLQVLADMAAIQSLAGTDPALSYADEDASIRKFVANISSANGYARDLFRVNTYPCNSQGYPCGFATTDHGHSSAHDAEHQDCQGPTHQHSGGGDSGKGDSGKSSRLPENEPEGGTSPNSVPLASPRELAFLSTLGILPQEELPAWRKSGALNLADAHNGVGNDVHSGHSGHGMVASMPTPTVADICRVEVSATVSSPSFFAAIFRISSFTIGIWAVAQRDVNTTTPTRPPCAFWGRSSVRIFGNPFLDSYDSSLGSSYVSQAIHTDSNGLGFAREQAVGCSDSTMDYNGNIDHHGGASSVGQLSISGNSFDIFGNVTT